MDLCILENMQWTIVFAHWIEWVFDQLWQEKANFPNFMSKMYAKVAT